MKQFILKSLLIVALFLLIGSCNNDGQEINTTEDFDSYLQEEMDAQKMPALSVLIFKEDNILHETYLGQTNIVQNTSLVNDHLFLLASVSKVITATALLQLYDDGLLSLDDNINDYLSFTVNHPDYTTAITIKMLLTHTSGIADGSALDSQYYYGEDSPIALDSFMENYLVPNGSFYADENFYPFEPGEKHEYSNTGSALMAVLVEQISGMSFNEYCKQHIFIPLQMTNTSWRLDEITQTIVQPYKYTNNQFEAIDHYTFTDYPNGGLRSTAQDLSTFFGAFTLDGTVNNYELLKAQTISEMLTPQIPSIDNEVGLHIFQMEKDNNLWGHDGGEQGTSTLVAFNSSTKVGAIILTNREDMDLDDILIEAYLLGLKL